MADTSTLDNESATVNINEKNTYKNAGGHSLRLSM